MENDFKKEFIDKYKVVGEQKFYNFILTFGIDKLSKLSNGDIKGISPEIEFIDYYDKFLMLYRRNNDKDCLLLAKIFRKAAHKIYRVGLKKKLIDKNTKFLNVV